VTDGIALTGMLDNLNNRPIFVDLKDLHSTWCNTAALKDLGIDDSTPDPAGGHIHRDESGKASGLLSEAASQILVWSYLDKVTPLEEKKQVLRDAGRTYNQAGYTGMIEMAMDESQWEVLQSLHAEGKLTYRLAAHWLMRPSKDEDDLKARVIELQEKYNAETSPALRVAGIKIICDGVIDACTAAVSQPYDNGVSCPPIWTAEVIAPLVKRVRSARHWRRRRQDGH